MLDNVLVIGGSGFIGKRLLQHHPEWDNIDLVNGIDFAYEPTRALDYDIIILLAAKLGNSDSDYRNNLEIYASLVHAALDSDSQPFVIYASSAAVYEAAIGEHYEDELPNPTTLYGKSKFLGELIVQDVCDKYTILRFSNVYGDGDGNGAIDIFKRGGRSIYGDGEQVRDYVYVNKVVTAIERVVASPDRYAGQLFNISSGVGQTVNEVFGKYGKGEPEYLSARPDDVPHSILNNELAKKEGLL